MSTTDPLSPAGEETLAAFDRHAPDVVRHTVRKAMDVPGTSARLGPTARQILTAGLQFTSDGLRTAMAYGTTDLLDDQLRWAIARLPHDGVPPSDLRHRLQLYGTAVRDLLPPEHAAVVDSYLDWMVRRLDELLAQAD